jgi:hypothetical protein
MTGAIYTYGSPRQDGGSAWFLWRKLRISLVVDIRWPDAPTREIGHLYALARGGERILILDKKPDPAKTWRHQAVMLPLARDQERYAQSAMTQIIGRIELAHVVGDLLIEPLELQRAIETKTKPVGKKWMR